MSNSFLMTKKSHDKLKHSIEKMTREDRPKIIKAIATARAHGDLSENAEYHAAKEEQRILENRIKEKERTLRNAQIVSIDSVSEDHVQFGVTVTLLEEGSDKNVTYHIVGELEANISQQRLSIASPLGKALLGKIVDDTVEVKTPSGNKWYTIQNITKQNEE